MTLFGKRPEAEREKTAEVYLKILNGSSMWDLWQLARERDGLSPLEMTEQRAQFCK